MKPEIKESWIKAIESGNYEKGNTFLRQEVETGKYSYCALGVLADLYITEHPDTEWAIPPSHCGDDRNVTYTGPGGTRCAVGDEVLQWAGVTDDPYLRFTDDDGYLTSIASISDVHTSWSPVLAAIHKHF